MVIPVVGDTNRYVKDFGEFGTFTNSWSQGMRFENKNSLNIS